MLLYYLFWCAIAYFFIHLFKFGFYQVKLYRLMKTLPGPDIRIPFWGNLDLFWAASKIDTNLGNEYSDKMNMLFREYSTGHGIIRLWMGPFIPIILVDDIKLARRLFHKHLDKSSQYRILTLLVGSESLITCPESNYKNVRNFFAPHFRIGVLDSYIFKTINKFPQMNRHLDRVIDECNGHLSKPDKFVSSYVFETVADNFLSVKFNSIAEEKVPYYIEKLFDFITVFDNIYVEPWVHAFKWRIVIGFMTGVNQIFVHKLNQFRIYCHYSVGVIMMIRDVHSRLKDAPNQPSEPSILESLILANIIQKKGYYQKLQGFFNVYYHQITIINTSYISTAPTITGILYLLAKYPDVQAKLTEEIEHFQDLLTSNEFSYLSLKRLKYMDAVLNESFRLNPPVNFIGRTTSTPEVLNDHITIPANVDIVLSLHHILKSAKYFREPEHFNPERFLEHSSEKHSKASEAPLCNDMAFIPFSFGTRICPGRDYSIMAIKLFLINMLSNYSFELFGPIDDSVQHYAIFQSPRKFGLKLYKRM